MANGAHALHIVPEPITSPADDKAEAALGAVVANAVTTFCISLQNYQHLGRLDPELREAGGNRVAQLAELWLAHEGTDHDFIDTARHQGKVQLRQLLTSDFLQRFGTVQGDSAIDFFLDSIFEVTTRVVAVERAMRRAEAH